MSVALVFLTPPVRPPLAVVLTGRALEIGRHPDCAVRLAEPTVGSRHLTLRRRGQVYVMTDEGSPNGTLVLAAGSEEPVFLGPSAPRVIQDRDRVHLGHVVIELRTRPPFFAEGEVQLLPDAAAIAESAVRAAMDSLSLAVSEAELARAVDALLQAPEERIQRPAFDAELARRAQAELLERDVVLRDPRPFDWVISLCALGLTSIAGAALYQLMTRN